MRSGMSRPLGASRRRAGPQDRECTAPGARSLTLGGRSEIIDASKREVSPMPVIMFKVSTEKSPHKHDAKELEKALRAGVDDAGGKLVCLHSGGGGVAYGIVEGPHDYDGV